jgi:hypothetical protein
MRLPLIKYGNIVLTNKNPPSAVSFMPALLFLQTHRETVRFFAVSGVQLAQSTSGKVHLRTFPLPPYGVLFVPEIKSRQHPRQRCSFTYQLYIDGAPITSRTHTHPSHSQTSRLLTSSLSLGVPVPRATQCM